MTNAKHLDEWIKGSGISPEIAQLNISTLTDSKAIAKLLGWRAWIHDFGGWQCHGLDLSTGKKGKGQFKPDKPIEISDGKLAKYLTGKSYDAIALKMPDEDYWQSVIDDVTKPVVIAEGAKKAGALLTCGYAALALCGVDMVRLRNGHIVRNLKALAQPGRHFVICFDSDSRPETVKNVGSAIDRLAKLLMQHQCTVAIATWDSSLGKGIDDVLVTHGKDKVVEMVGEARSLQKWRQTIRQITSSTPKSAANDSGKPRLDIRVGELHQIANKVLAHFASVTNPRNRIYAQGNSQGYSLVRVLKTAAAIESRYLHVSQDNDVLDPLTADSLQCQINQTFEIYRWTEKDDVSVEKRADCPANLAKHILAMGRWSQLPILRGLSYIPLLAKDGEIIEQPGYHLGTGFLLQFDPSDFELKTSPTKDDAIVALALLKDLLKEFCFKTDLDRSAALSLLLTAVSRRLYPLAPLHAISAHQAGTGKGTLVNLACILATGNKEVGAAGFTDDEAEMGKRVLATLLSGTPIFIFDNVDRRLGGGTIERVLTAEYYTDRILGVSKNATCSTQVTWIANGNNLSFTADMPRRTILIELDAEMESPETRTFSRDIEAYTLQNRGKLVSAALTIPQAYLRAGSPTSKDTPAPLGSFGGWDVVVRRSLLWLGEPDPVQTQSTIREADDARITHAVFMDAWYAKLGSAPNQVREIVQMAIADNGEFKNAVFDICLDRQGQPSSKMLGYYLRKHAGVVVNGYRLVRGTRATAGFPWKVEQVSPKKSFEPETSTSSTSSTSSNREIVDTKAVEANVDKNGIYIETGQRELHLAANNVDAKTSTLHLHRPEMIAEKAFQDLSNFTNVDDVDTSNPKSFLGVGDRCIVTTGRYENVRVEIVAVNQDGSYECRDVAGRWRVDRTYPLSSLKLVEEVKHE